MLVSFHLLLLFFQKHLASDRLFFRVPPNTRQNFYKDKTAGSN